MIISVNWLKKFTEIAVPIDELVTLIGSRLVEIEAVSDLGAKYEGAIIARIMQCEDIEGSDHLHRCLLDDSGVVDGVERNDDDHIQVVCGAPNVREGQMVVWLPPNSTVPATYGTSEPFVLGSRMLRGVMSNGMIASAKELDLFDDHTGILEIDADAMPGASFSKTYELDDYLLDIENKSLTHRPDCFGIIGFAREVAAIQGKAFTTPDWLQLLDNQLSYEGDITPLSVTIDAPELCDRYQAIVLKNINPQATSPLWMQTYLARVGVRPINGVVDITNYLMMLTGQPTHAFDYDKVLQKTGSPDVHVRAGRAGETLLLLDGRKITVTPEDIVIAAGDTAIALAGAMGGAETEIDEHTTTVILESATFNLFNLRGTQMRHGVFSEAITRFTKGQPAALTAPILHEASRLLIAYTGAKAASSVVEAYPPPTEQGEILVETAKVNALLGSDVTADTMQATLQNAEIHARSDQGVLHVTPPYWRADLHIPEDIIEEIGRINGYDLIAPTVPRRYFTPVRPRYFDEFCLRLRQLLIRAGVNEVLTYTFVHGDLLTKAGQDPANSYRLVNSLSPDLQYYRQTLTPSLLSHVHANLKQGFDEFALAEMNKVHQKSQGVDQEGVPVEAPMLATVVASKQAQGSPYYKAKGLLDFVAKELGLELLYARLEEDSHEPLLTPFQPQRAAVVSEKHSGAIIGVVGEYKKPLAKAFKLPEFCAGFEINLAELARLAVSKKAYRPLSRYPSIERDVCFQVASDVTYQSVADAVADALAAGDLQVEISPIDIYQPDTRSEKNITLRFMLTSKDKTLTSEEAQRVLDQVAQAVKAATGAEVI